MNTLDALLKMTYYSTCNTDDMLNITLFDSSLVPTFLIPLYLILE